MSRTRLLCLATLTLVMLSGAFGSTSSVMGGQSIPTYSIHSSPSAVNLNQTVQISVTLTGGSGSQEYAFTISVTKPDSIAASTVKVLTTDKTGFGAATASYPADFSPQGSGPGTNQVGTYYVRVDQTFPYYRYSVASSSFRCSSNLTLAIVSPISNAQYARGTNIDITALVSHIDGSPVTQANVTASGPGNSSQIELTQESQSGLYSSSYSIKYSDPEGVWPIKYIARDLAGNYGSESLSVNITRNTIIVQQLASVDSSMESRTSFFNNSTVLFTIDASYPDGSQVFSGASSIRISDPKGKVVVTLAAVYVPDFSRYVTVTGYYLNGTSLTGTWSAELLSNSLRDFYGNVGPTAALTIHFQVQLAPAPSTSLQDPSTIPSYVDLIPVALLGVSAIIPVVAFRRRSARKQSDDSGLLVKLGSLSPFTLIEGESQTGKSSFVYRAIEEFTSKGHPCILLTFEAPSAEVCQRMSLTGVDAEELESKQLLRFVDCSDVAHTLSVPFLRAELLKVLGSSAGSFALFIDSLNLMFDDLDETDVEKLLSGVIQETLHRGGQLYSTITYNGFSPSLMTNLESKAGLILQTDKTTTSTPNLLKLKIKKAPATKELSLKSQLVFSLTSPPNLSELPGVDNTY